MSYMGIILIHVWTHTGRPHRACRCFRRLVSVHCYEIFIMCVFFVIFVVVLVHCYVICNGFDDLCRCLRRLFWCTGMGFSVCVLLLSFFIGVFDALLYDMLCICGWPGPN